jgi:hypothetical protein
LFADARACDIRTRQLASPTSATTQVGSALSTAVSERGHARCACSQESAHDQLVRTCNEAEDGSDRKAALTQRVEQARAAKRAREKYLKELQDKHSKASDRSKEERTELLRLENAFKHCVDPSKWANLGRPRDAAEVSRKRKAASIEGGGAATGVEQLRLRHCVSSQHTGKNRCAADALLTSGRAWCA